MTWLRKSQVIAAVVFLVLIALVWFAGPAVGLARVEARFAWIFVLMLVWVVILMTGRVLRERSATLLERMLRRKADDAVVSAAPEHRTEAAQLRQRLLAAIDTLKTSNLGRTRGRAALYELPWYMIVGHPSAGKSCAILNSGLKFPLGGKDKASVQGVGGTRNCDWFFSTEGVLLDTAGRYASQAEDRSEWIEFLKLLKKHRPKAPLNGILVAISLSELLQHRTESFAHYARQIRQRINEVDELFGFKTPVYLVVTKLDLLQGFDQFFEDFPEEERKQVWGATLNHEQEAGFDAVRVVDQHFEALFRGLAQMGTDKLASARANQKRPALFAFPLEFHGLKEALCRFVEALVERDPYHTSPLLRGFYFTSALQDRRPCVTTANHITRRFGLSCPGPHRPEKLDSRPFFLESLFRKVVFPDMFLVGRASRPGQGRLRLAGLALGMALLTVMAGGWTWSFVCNQKLIQEARAELGTARDLAHRPDLADRMKALQVLQYRLEQLDHYHREGHPWSLGWGLYQGTDVEAVLRSEYFQGVRQLMLTPIREGLEASLEDRPAAGPVPPQRVEEVYNTLKTYLMLHRRERMETAHLVDQLPRHWRPWLDLNRGACPMADLSRMAERVVAFYVSQAGAPDLPLIGNRDDLVGRARQRIKGEVALLSPLERIYGELKAQGNTRLAPVSVASILENKNLDLVGSSVFVPGSFTREGWRTYFQDAIQQASTGQFKGTDWVLADPLEPSAGLQGSAEERRDRLTAMYQADYIKAWDQFIQGIVVHPFGSPDRAADGLGRLGDPQHSPIKLILARAAAETAWDNPSELSRSLDKAKQNILEKTTGFLNGGASANPAAGTRLGPVGSHFAPTAGLVAGPNPPLDAYLDQLGKLRSRMAAISASGDAGSGAKALIQATLAGSGSELGDALQAADATLLARLDTTAREALRPLLVKPLMECFATLVGPAQDHLNAIWQQQVYAPWSSLAAKYPFADSGNEAPMGDIARFLKPGDGTLARYVDKELGAMVVRRGDAYVSRTWGGLGVGLGSGFLNAVSRLSGAGSALLQEGDACRFELQPVPTPGLTDILLEIDGQKLLYRMGPQSWTTFTWPGPSSGQGARLQATSFGGATVQVQNFPARLGFLRLLDQARIENPAGPATSLAWRLRVPPAAPPHGSAPASARPAPTADGIRFNFRLVSGANPMGLFALRHSTLPQRIGN